MTEKGLILDFLVRLGIQKLLRERLSELCLDNCERQFHLQNQYLKALAESHIVEVLEKVNQQHYELPPRFFEQVLGPHLKYSCGWWEPTTSSLAVSESEALKHTCDNAELLNGQNILELGCGWGSLSLWMAENYPDSTFTSVSNSVSQKAFIDARASERNLKNLKVITCDMNDFHSDQCFDRIVSVEMFEHMINWPMLFNKISGWMKKDAKFLMHVFCHRLTPYFFKAANDDD